jgi:hypothetical protein
MSIPKEKHTFKGSIRKITTPWSTKGDKPTNHPTQPSGTPGSATNPSSSSCEQASSSQARTSFQSQRTSTENAAPPPIPTVDSAPTTMSATESVPSQDGSRRLNCLIEGKYNVFLVTVGCDCVVSDLKKEIIRERALDTLKNVGPHILELWKVSAIGEL